MINKNLKLDNKITGSDKNRFEINSRDRLAVSQV